MIENTSTISNSEARIPGTKELLKIIENLKTYEVQQVEKFETSKPCMEKLKEQFRDHLGVVELPEELKPKGELSLFCGIKIEENWILPDNIIVVNYENGSKEIFNFETGVKFKLLNYLDRFHP